MRALAEIQVVPLGVGPSVRKEVMRAHQLLAESGLRCELHAYGTNVEGVVRLVTNVKLGTRTDKVATLAGKLSPSG